LSQTGDRRGRVGRIGGVPAGSAARPRRVAVAFEFGDLALDPLEALDLAADFDRQTGRQRAAVAGDQSGQSVAAVGPARTDVVDPHRHQQTADAIDMTGLLMDQAFALAAGAPGILGRGLGNVDHGAQPALAAIPGGCGSQDRLDVDRIGLFAPGAAVDLQRARIDNLALDPGGDQPPVQPEAFVTSLVA
jgi:hypothetical protein